MIQISRDMSSLGQTATTQALPDNSDGIQLTKFAADDILPLEYAPPIGPELVSQDQLPAAWAYKRFRDLDDKESYRRKLLQELTDALAAQGSEAAEIATAALRDLIDQMAEQGAVVLADIVESDDFLELVKRYDELMAREGSRSFIHRFLDLRRSPGMLTDPAVNGALVHPLMIALISYAVGGPIRMIDARGKDAEPLSVLAQDNMLHIDNTPFNDEYKILITWRRGTAQGPAGQNFTFLPGTHKLARTCFVNEDGVPCARSCIILVFHRVADNPGRMVSDVEDSSDVSLSELLTRGVPDESYQQRFIATLCAAADEIAELLLKWKKTPQRPVSLPLQTKQIDGARFEEWISAATEAPEVREIRNRELTIPYGEVLSAEEFFDLIWRLMRFDKHGPLDLILYHDNREEPRKWARNLIREMSADRLYERLLGWLADIQQPRPADCLRPLQIHALISEVLKTLPLDEDQDPPADWHFDLLGMSHAEAARSVKHLLEDVAEALLRCEDMAAYLSTSLFAFWAVDAAYSLDGRRNLVVKDCARRLLRHYTMLSLTCFQ
ncbi:hypothetical protein [Mycobacterium tuberculosis]|uniref:hypothetical protein n=1 Tax=Mycobacterium tuberculosis TaxID=1773 RepID=UPI0004B7F522|nr:hypothetical protein [Mycobacterium tuberculosis]